VPQATAERDGGGEEGAFARVAVGAPYLGRRLPRSGGKSPFPGPGGGEEQGLLLHRFPPSPTKRPSERWEAATRRPKRGSGAGRSIHVPLPLVCQQSHQQSQENSSSFLM
jgi:hypothetical protein